jgi:hypothetical protein
MILDTAVEMLPMRGKEMSVDRFGYFELELGDLFVE